jgi:hypothetical protein
MDSNKQKILNKKDQCHHWTDIYSTPSYYSSSYCLAPQQQSFCLNAQSHPQFTPQLRVPGRLTVNKGLVMGWGWGWPLKKNKMIPWNGLKVKNECFQAVIYIDGQWWDLIMWSSENKLHWQTICFLVLSVRLLPFIRTLNVSWSSWHRSTLCQLFGALSVVYSER